MDTTKHLNPLLELLKPQLTTLDEVPEGFHTAEEWAKLSGCAHNTIRHKLSDLSKTGKVKVIKVRKFTTGRGNFPIPYYGYVKP